MSGERQYYEDSATGEYFYWWPDGGVFVGYSTQRRIAPHTAEARRLVTPRNFPAQVPGAGGAPANPAGPAQQNYTHQSRTTQRPARRVIRDSAYEELDPRYRRKPHSFFSVGRVFMVHWPEPAGEETVVTSFIEEAPQELSRDPRFGQGIHSKIRRFIVVRFGSTYSVCVRITTYGGQGTAKRGVNMSEHAIAYSGRDTPRLLPLEAQNGGASYMRPAIRIQPDEVGDRLLDESRIDYGRLYTVEHNVKARPFGLVHPDSEMRFTYDFRIVNGLNPTQGAQSGDGGSSDRASSSRQQQ